MPNILVGSSRFEPSLDFPLFNIDFLIMPRDGHLIDPGYQQRLAPLALAAGAELVFRR